MKPEKQLSRKTCYRNIGTRGL